MTVKELFIAVFVYLFISVYLFIGGALLGWKHNLKYERCKKPIPIVADEIIQTIAWPAGIAFALVVKEDHHEMSPCPE